MAKPKRSKTLAEQLADIDGPAPADFDPEEPDNYASESEDSDSEPEAADGREHYVDVGKSKLRKPAAAPLGPKYKGARVSRDAVEDEDSDDPFSKGFDEESSEEEEDAAHDEDEDDGMGSEGEEEGTDATDLSAEDEDDEDDEDDDDDDDDDDEDEDMEDAKPAIDRAELRKLMNEEQKTVAATISEAAKADAEKGRAVKAQRKTFDSLLNTRIRLQKALIATNSMAAPQAKLPADASEAEDPIRAAEEAACNLWNSLNDLRESLHTARTGTKRKRGEISTSTATEDAWSQMQSYEAATVPHRQAVLEKWSSKARGVSALPARSKLNNAAAAQQQTIIDVLSAQLADSVRLVKRTQTPRSCAPLQAAAATHATDSPAVFDDADFYGLLLKELLEQRSQDASSGAAGLAFNVPHWQAARDAKTKRHVDTRASKGRKLRYTVHEKLQNFMAPEERGAWGERQADELFGSLFGRRMALAEDEADGVASGAEDDDDEDLGEQGLMLFRN
ncbi:uncharacterized protein K452DRAFT_266520 [Aplosporella prunicola CBS 121167]|uniref:Protein BFR2 n=1 Tax=Aplosporella prunicola CBS 121167 TaxID=1176127 RepID=A0A6A6BME2_9PEZI|nr:uncharacterized protein K452DRAFT_266520 [Aplosporella prunicola CBS 121167]KAF2144573.1 hypothetical protein K452DRAFT_266520 [Aplosporella prunicola CBS 121167]